MNKVRWIWISLLAAGAVAALAFLGGCSRQGSAAGGHRGGRHAVEAACGEYRNGPEERGRSGQGKGRPEAAQGRQGQGRQEAVQAQYRSAAPRGGGQRAGRRDGAHAAPKAADELNGRSVAETGRLAEFTGRLDSERSEWYLITEGARLALHLGNTRYVESTGIRLQEGAAAKVRGFAEADEVAVVWIELDGQRFAFRTEEGVPLWAGRGRQAATGRGGGAGRQNGSRPLLEG